MNHYIKKTYASLQNATDTFHGCIATLRDRPEMTHSGLKSRNEEQARLL